MKNFALGLITPPPWSRIKDGKHERPGWQPWLGVTFCKTAMAVCLIKGEFWQNGHRQIQIRRLLLVGILLQQTFRQIRFSFYKIWLQYDIPKDGMSLWGARRSQERQYMCFLLCSREKKGEKKKTRVCSSPFPGSTAPRTPLAQPQPKRRRRRRDLRRQEAAAAVRLARLIVQARSGGGGSSGSSQQRWPQKDRRRRQSTTPKLPIEAPLPVRGDSRPLISFPCFAARWIYC